MGGGGSGVVVEVVVMVEEEVGQGRAVCAKSREALASARLRLPRCC